jgi:hypothetical protein
MSRRIIGAHSWGLAVLFATTLCSQPSVLTWQNDNFRSGQNLLETILTPANVKSASFGRLFTLAVDGKVDAQPLYVPGLTIPGQGAHDVLYVVTEHDSVYAFDADNGTLLKSRTILVAPEAPSDDRGCGQVTPEIGITSTPAIDPHSGPNGTMYLIAMTKDGGGKYHHRLHALDLTTLAEEFGGPVEIAATYPGSQGVEKKGSGDTVQTFNPAAHKERSALLLLNGVIYTSWSSHCDAGSYTGWVMGYNEATLQQTSVLNLTPNGNDGGMWSAGSGPAADASGNLYMPLGNGTFDTTLLGSGLPSKGDYGNAYVRMSTTGGQLAAADYFTMTNTVSESNGDTDLGSGGGMLLPPLNDSGGNSRQLAVVAGKDQNIYVMDRTNLGKFHPSADEIYQQLTGVLSGGVWSSPAWFNGRLYYGAQGNVLKAFAFTSGKFGTNPDSQSSATFPYPGVTPSISANGSSNGIVWAISNSSPAVLRAYDATNLSTELYDSNQAANAHDHFGGGNKFIVPTVVNGKVYAASNGGVSGSVGSVGVFGLLAPPDFSLSETPGVLTVAPGGSGQSTITVAAAAGFNGIVSFSASGLPVGATALFSPTTVTGSGATTMTISTTGSVRTGTFSVTVTGTSGSLVHSSTTFLAVAVPGPSSAAFVKQDSSTQGSWEGVYGQDGYVVIGDLTSNPSYVTPVALVEGQGVWGNSPTDIRALQKASNPSSRIAGVWYSFTSFTVDLNITDGNTHQVALYCLDWDRLGRSETVAVTDANGNVLNSESVTNFGGGVYLVWNVSGHVKIQVTLTGGVNAVATGLFFGGVGTVVSSTGTAAFVKQDTTTQGTWQGVYGADGYLVIGDLTSNPSYVTPLAAGEGQGVWGNSPTDIRALQKPSNPASRIAGVWYSSTSFTVDLNITDGNTHQVALYCLDWDRLGRSETVSITDANGNVLNSQSVTNFGGGVYLVWNVSGHVKIQVTLTGGVNAVATGLFFGGGGTVVVSSTGTAAFVKQDTTTQGTWQGVYGADGYLVIGDLTSNPSYVTPVALVEGQGVWGNSPTDIRALQKPSNPASRIAGVWYSFTSFTVDLNITDSNTHQVALYCLDWDRLGRSETVAITDANGNVLNSQSVTNFGGGVYLVWNVSGHVKIQVTLTSGINAVATGLFFH